MSGARSSALPTPRFARIDWVTPALTAIFFLSGASGLVYQISWIRLLSLTFGVTIYAVSTVVAAFMGGLALGSFVGGRWADRVGRPILWYAAVELLIGMAGIGAPAALSWVQTTYLALYPRETSQAALAVVVLRFALASLVLLVPTTLMGATLPLMVKSSLLVGRTVGARVSWLYASNTAGAVLGTIAGGFFLIGSLGISGTISVAAALNLTAALSGRARAGGELAGLYAANTAGAILGTWTAGFLLLPELGSQRSIELLAVINGLLAVGLALAGGPRRLMSAGAGAALILGSFALVLALAPDMYGQMVTGRFGREVVWVGEGRETSVAVLYNRDGDRLDMFLNGQGQASDESETVWFHRLLGHLPMTLHPDPRDVLIVGIGGGATAGALAQHGPSRMDVVELSDTVVDGARHFNHVNGDVLHYPNLRLTIDDGRNYLLLTDQRYDVITADVIHPRNAGSAVLYSDEYYQLARKALKPGGVMAQWLEDRPENPDNDAQRRLMTRTFVRTFPHATMWAFGELLIGTEQPVDVSVESLARRWRQRNLDVTLAGTRFGSPEAFRSLFNMSDAELRAWAGDGPIMTDDHPYIEYFLSLPGGTPGWRGRTTPTHPG